MGTLSCKGIGKKCARNTSEAGRFDMDASLRRHTPTNPLPSRQSHTLPAALAQNADTGNSRQQRQRRNYSSRMENDNCARWWMTADQTPTTSRALFPPAAASNESNPSSPHVRSAHSSSTPRHTFSEPRDMGNDPTHMTPRSSAPTNASKDLKKPSARDPPSRSNPVPTSARPPQDRRAGLTHEILSSPHAQALDDYLTTTTVQRCSQ
ncbi:hypothetical protein DFP72DRAFT_82858 [Ephemerocybe angulata]|uniref:Uncharacterized protein n=1 Tax=Ephemerocybe angulata TaxID=980116 RepID=A0A8H6HEI1_9AGAR|nr:hypothetical protein DFP72DRAFT_82858 [Tulosesus angulatus]